MALARAFLVSLLAGAFLGVASTVPAFAFQEPDCEDVLRNNPYPEECIPSFTYPTGYETCLTPPEPAEKCCRHKHLPVSPTPTICIDSGNPTGNECVFPPAVGKRQYIKEWCDQDDDSLWFCNEDDIEECDHTYDTYSVAPCE